MSVEVLARGDVSRGVIEATLGAGGKYSVAKRPYWLVTEWWGLVRD